VRRKEIGGAKPDRAWTSPTTSLDGQSTANPIVLKMNCIAAAVERAAELPTPGDSLFMVESLRRRKQSERGTIPVCDWGSVSGGETLVN
jgi:hypothetical protein